MRKIIATVLVSAGLLFAGLSGVSANESQHSAMQCGGTGLNLGQALQLPGLIGGPAAGPNQNQLPPEFAELLGADSVGDLIQRDCVIN